MITTKSWKVYPLLRYTKRKDMLEEWEYSNSFIFRSNIAVKIFLFTIMARTYTATTTKFLLVQWYCLVKFGNGTLQKKDIKQ